APGSMADTSLPGRVVPPPRPAIRERRPAARASAISSARRIEASLDAHSNEGTLPRNNAKGGRGTAPRRPSLLDPAEASPERGATHDAAAQSRPSRLCHARARAADRQPRGRAKAASRRRDPGPRHLRPKRGSDSPRWGNLRRLPKKGDVRHRPAAYV